MPSGDFAHNPRTLLHIAAHLRSRGVSPVEIFTRVGVPPSALVDSNGWVSRELCFALSEAAETVTGDRIFCSKIGDSYRLTELGVWGRTIAGAANVGEACTVAAKNVGLLHQGTNLRFVKHRRHAELRFAYRGHLRTNPRQHLMGTLAVLRKIALLANAPEAISVRFSMPHSSGADCLEETHGSRLEFGCDHDAIIMDRGILNVELNRSPDDGAATRLEPVESAEAIGSLLKHLLPYGRANIKSVAAQMRVSPRTVQRMLKVWGFSFHEILDDLRRTEATRHVLSGECSAMEMALLLGYSDPAHFTRAFRRWTGMSPREYRRLANTGVIT